MVKTMNTYEDYKLYPKGKGRMVEEIKTAFNDYDGDLLRNSDFMELMKHYHDLMDLSTGESDYLDPKIANKIGKNRALRLSKLLGLEL